MNITSIIINFLIFKLNQSINVESCIQIINKSFSTGQIMIDNDSVKKIGYHGVSIEIIENRHLYIFLPKPIRLA